MNYYKVTEDILLNNSQGKDVTFNLLDLIIPSEKPGIMFRSFFNVNNYQFTKDCIISFESKDGKVVLYLNKSKLTKIEGLKNILDYLKIDRQKLEQILFNII